MLTNSTPIGCDGAYIMSKTSDWSLTTHGHRFRLNNHGIKLIAIPEEKLQKVIFDIEKHTITVVTEKQSPKFTKKDPPRTADMSDDECFFEDLRIFMKHILKLGDFNDVTYNEEQTEYTIHWDE